MTIENLSPLYRCADGNVVQFGEMAVPHIAMTEKEGRPVFFRSFVAIFRSPAMKNQMHVQEIDLRDESGKIVRRKICQTNRDKTRLHWDEVLKDQIRAYREGREGTDALGTPLTMYPKIDVAMMATLKAAGVHTLEQLKAVPDAQLDGLGPQSRVLRDGAATFLDSMTGKNDLRAENADMKNQLAALAVQIAALTAAQAAPKKRGRKSKADLQAAA